MDALLKLRTPAVIRALMLLQSRVRRYVNHPEQVNQSLIPAAILTNTSNEQYIGKQVSVEKGLTVDSAMER